MKIGIFTNCYLPMVNGIVKMISLLKKGLTEQGHQVYIFAPEYDDYRDQEEQVYRFPAFDLTRRIKYPIPVPWSPKIHQLIHDLDLDIVHCHHPFILGRLGVKVAWQKKIPVVFTFHTQYEQYAHYVPLPQWVVKFFTKHLVSKFCGTVDEIIIPAESAKQILQDYGINNRVRVIPNPIDLSQFQNRNGGVIRKRYGLKGEKLLITIGRVAPEKNLPFLLEMYQYIQRQTAPDTTRLMIVGAGPELDSLQERAEKLGIAAQVIFTGLVDPAEIPNYLAAADIFVMASHSEVKPLAQLEAMAAGLPIVAVSAPGAVDTVIHGENGFLVKEDLMEFSLAVLEIISNPEKQLQFQKAAQKTAANYSHIKIARDYGNLYDDLIQNNSRPHPADPFWPQRQYGFKRLK
ncbi:MAG: glycosyltransferase family 4 protein [Firmicutes bacterium]|nr:glycosyltransferase family 4 protein [Bacillota bacterium]